MKDFEEYTPEQLGKIIHAVFGTLRTSDLSELYKAEVELATANMHYGLNAQVDANIKMSETVKEAVKNIRDFGQKELSKKIDCAIHNKEYTL